MDHLLAVMEALRQQNETLQDSVQTHLAHRQRDKNIEDELVDPQPMAETL